MADEVLRERRGRVEILTINRPEARNAINLATAKALSSALDDAERDEGCRVVIVTGAGEKAFSAGMDLKAFAQGEAPMTEHGFAGMTKREFPKPIIAAVNGPALAGGFEIMLSCDLVVAASHATFGIPEAARGLIAGGVEQPLGLHDVVDEAHRVGPCRVDGCRGQRELERHGARDPLGDPHLQARDARVARVHRGGGLGAQRRVVRRDRPVPRRHRGRGGVRREARAGLDRRLTL